MSPIDRLEWLAEVSRAGLPGRCLRTATAIAWHTNQQTGRAWPSVATMARHSGCDERSVRRALRELVESGFLRDQPSRGNRPSVYQAVQPGALDQGRGTRVGEPGGALDQGSGDRLPGALDQGGRGEEPADPGRSPPRTWEEHGTEPERNTGEDAREQSNAARLDSVDSDGDETDAELARMRGQAPRPPTDAAARLSDGDRWRMEIASQPWVRSVKRAGGKIGPGNWITWEALIEKYGEDSVIEATGKTAPDRRWPDQVEVHIANRGRGSTQGVIL